MSIQMTGYKDMAPPYATRVPTVGTLNFAKLSAGHYWGLPPDEDMEQLKSFWEISKCEYPAIYFWTDDPFIGHNHD